MRIIYFWNSGSFENSHTSKHLWSYFKTKLGRSSQDIVPLSPRRRHTHEDDIRAAPRWDIGFRYSDNILDKPPSRRYETKYCSLFGAVCLKRIFDSISGIDQPWEILIIHTLLTVYVLFLTLSSDGEYRAVSSCGHLDLIE